MIPGSKAEGWTRRNSLWVDRYGSWLMSRENSPHSSVCFCVHERQRQEVHRKLPAASCVGGFTLATVTWAGRVFPCALLTPGLSSSSTERKAFGGRHPGIIMHLQQASLVSLLFTKIGKTLIKIEWLPSKSKQSCWINLSYKFRSLNINFLLANLNF